MTIETLKYKINLNSTELMLSEVDTREASRNNFYLYHTRKLSGVFRHSGMCTYIKVQFKLKFIATLLIEYFYNNFTLYVIKLFMFIILHIYTTKLTQHQHFAATLILFIF